MFFEYVNLYMNFVDLSVLIRRGYMKIHVNLMLHVSMYRGILFASVSVNATSVMLETAYFLVKSVCGCRVAINGRATTVGWKHQRFTLTVASPCNVHLW